MVDATVKSAARAFEIIEAFRSEHRRMTAAQLGTLLDYPRSSLNVLLKSLAAQGYLSFAARDQSYFPTLHVTHLGDWVPNALFGSSGALELLQQLRDSTRETVTLTMATGLNMRCLIALNGSHPIGLQLSEGTLFPIFASGVGIAYLSTLNGAAVAGLRKPRRGSPAPSMLDNFEDQLSAARDKGYCTLYDAVLPDAGAVAMPLAIPSYGETLVVAVAGLSPRIRAAEAKILQDLKRCVDRLAAGQ